MVKLRIREYWPLLPLFMGLREFPGVRVHYYAVEHNKLYTAHTPGAGVYIQMDAYAVWVLYQNQPRFYVLIGKRPHLHLVIVLGEELDDCIRYVKETYCGNSVIEAR
ncbi:hypothetical protein LCGC14_0620530 [marine sediment metagenome]|uniref:Uncharacterized protein n=1 Tax=marine sediment metagenome TaxID=412755 RepID=A0A0F9R4X1_9ZZZZ